MNQQSTPWTELELLEVLNDEELIRLSYRLRRAGKYLSSLALDQELARRIRQLPPRTLQDRSLGAISGGLTASLNE